MPNAGKAKRAAAVTVIFFCLQCSKTCGEGEQTRAIRCLNVDEYKRPETKYCDLATRPADRRPCNGGSCGLTPHRYQWQTAAWSKVRLHTGPLTLPLPVVHLAPPKRGHILAAILPARACSAGSRGRACVRNIASLQIPTCNTSQCPSFRLPFTGERAEPLRVFQVQLFSY